MSSKKSLVTTTEEIVQEGINDMGTKPNLAKEAITTPIDKNNIYTVNKIEKPQASIKKKINPSAINQTKVTGPVGSNHGNLYHRWELPGNYRDFMVVMVIYLFCRRTKRVLITPFIDFKIYILTQSLIFLYRRTIG